MNLLSVEGISKAYGEHVIFEPLSFGISKGQKIALIAKNGSGKTTILKIIAGQETPDAGLVNFRKGIQVSFLQQEPILDPKKTVEEIILASGNKTLEVIAAYEKALLNPEDEEKYQEAFDAMEQHGAWDFETEYKQLLSKLKLDDLTLKVGSLSGGQKKRLALCSALLQKPNLLILDEPTNHLDLETLGWFQGQIQNFSGSVLTISHDRAFLNSICSGILEISNRKLHRYPGNFENFLIQKKEREAQHLAAYRNQQREIAHHEDFIRRFRAKASKASQAQARVKTLEKMERIDPPEEADATISFKFPQPPRSGQRVATLNHVRQAYGDHLVYSDLNLEVEKQERIALVGPNGAGKSTLLKILANLVPIQDGTHELGHNVSVGYFSQQRVEVLNLERSVVDEAMEHTDSSVHEQDARTLLGAFLFRGDDVFKKVKVLSGGEKSRLALVKLLLSPPNFLLLDEPTTHLDMASIDAVIQALRDYTGTLIFVSHDIHFIRALGKRTIRIESGKITNFAGNYDYYLWKSGSSDAQTGLIEGLRDARPEQTRSAESVEKVLSAKEKRRQRSQEREKKKAEKGKLEDKVRKLEKEILQLEEEQKVCNEELANPDSYNDSEKGKELNERASRLARNLQQRNYEWEIETEKLLQLDE